jgi:hypothetical protein
MNSAHFTDPNINALVLNPACEVDDVVAFQQLVRIVLENIDLTGIDHSADFFDASDLASEVLPASFQQFGSRLAEFVDITLPRGPLGPKVNVRENEPTTLGGAEVNNL